MPKTVRLVGGPMKDRLLTLKDKTRYLTVKDRSGYYAQMAGCKADDFFWHEGELPWAAPKKPETPS